MAPILEDVAAAAGCDYDFVNNLIRRNHLTTELPAARPGVARNFTRENALEIAFLRALVDIGHLPSVASAIAEQWIRAESAGTLPPWYIENRATGESATPSTSIAIKGAIETFALLLPDEAGVGELISEKAELTEFEIAPDTKPATRLAVIWLVEIVRRVDVLYRAADRPRSATQK
ncbi:hypothetical protein [Methylocella silvestris]|uniref:HTH merR-type domain-containing protein n=1 Tax=Methylocella silvestris TaxID=199596 RepID=A0A2J7TCJ3_METSI|nr:hypothetical protein [Methylocella silvestris]PNG24491.1 hypothetical protein CR492_18570 [Methylocella silvestris]